MKDSKVTGIQVYETIKKLKEEFKEIGEACVMVEKSLGTENKAYEILAELQRKKYEELSLNEKQTLTY